MKRFEKLPGLPGVGPLPEQFSDTGRETHSEGLVVRFRPKIGTSWVGNFQGGLSSFDAMLEHPDGRQVIVIAKGQGYIIDPETKRCARFFGGAIVEARRLKKRNLLIVNHQGIAFESIGHAGKSWHTRRLSWDGFRNIESSANQLKGEAWNPLGETWAAFVVSLETGASTGGSYEFPDAGEMERLLE